jgi:hypothetical protein
MKNRQQKNHNGTRNSSDLQPGKLILFDDFQNQYSLLWETESYYGTSGIATRVNCSSISTNALLLIIVSKTLTGLSELSVAILIMVISRVTLFLLRLVILPKVILRNKTVFLILCSTGLFVGGIDVFLNILTNRGQRQNKV